MLGEQDERGKETSNQEKKGLWEVPKKPDHATAFFLFSLLLKVLLMCSFFPPIDPLHPAPTIPRTNCLLSDFTLYKMSSHFSCTLLLTRLLCETAVIVIFLNQIVKPVSGHRVPGPFESPAEEGVLSEVAWKMSFGETSSSGLNL